MKRKSYSIECINSEKPIKCILTALCYEHQIVKGYKRKLVKALCDCGNITYVRPHYIMAGNTTSCGCRNKLPPPTVLDLKGQRFGRLIGLELDKERAGKWKRYWICLCDCGNKKSIITGALTSGGTKSCGCLNLNTPNRHLSITHGRSHTPIYNAWHSMKQRCYYKKNIGYKDYGGRGITVCDRWLHSFENFFEDMGEKPKGLTLDRLDSNKPYSKKNCRWATNKQQQSENKRGLHIVTINNETLTLTDAVAKYSTVGYDCVLRRIRFYKWDDVRAITTPNVQGQGKKLNKIHPKWLK